MASPSSMVRARLTTIWSAGVTDSAGSVAISLGNSMRWTLLHRAVSFFRVVSPPTFSIYCSSFSPMVAGIYSGAVLGLAIPWPSLVSWIRLAA